MVTQPSAPSPRPPVRPHGRLCAFCAPKRCSPGSPSTTHDPRPRLDPSPAHHAQGDLDYLWDVSTSAHYGPPGPLAYKLDTLVINRLLDALPRPVPSVLRVGSLRQVAPQLALNTSGRQQEHLKSAFHQNAAPISSPSCATGPRRGQRRLEAGFTRYSVVFQGEVFPDGHPLTPSTSC